MKRVNSEILIIFPVLTILAVFIGLSNSMVAPNEENRSLTDTNSKNVEKPQRPMIIWFHAIETEPEILRLAVSSGVFSHVMLRGLHEFDRPTEVIFANPKFKKELEYCKEYGVKVIWNRWLYPGYNFEHFSFENAFDAQYYMRQIRQIRKEAKLMEVDWVAFDAEPYGLSQLNKLRPDMQTNLSETEFEALNNAIQTAIKIEGQVDFILPSGAAIRRHLYNVTRSLGNFAISEHTYYDNPWRLKAEMPYDVFGAYVSVTKQNKKHPALPYFKPREILEKQYLWSHKKGLFVYPGLSEESAAVALEFSKISQIKPANNNENAN